MNLFQQAWAKLFRRADPWDRAYRTAGSRSVPTRWWRRRPSPAMLRIGLAVVGLTALAWFILRDHGLLDHARLRHTLDSLDQRSRRLKAEIAWYHDRNQRLQSRDPLVLEEEARRMGMARPGEEIYRVVLPEDTATQRKE